MLPLYLLVLILKLRLTCTHFIPFILCGDIIDNSLHPRRVSEAIICWKSRGYFCDNCDMTFLTWSLMQGLQLQHLLWVKWVRSWRLVSEFQSSSRAERKLIIILYVPNMVWCLQTVWFRLPVCCLVWCNVTCEQLWIYVLVVRLLLTCKTSYVVMIFLLYLASRTAMFTNFFFDLSLKAKAKK